MKENIVINNKEEIVKIIDAVIDFNVPVVANLSNLSRLIMDTFKGTSWSGFYLTTNNILYLGPFQGDIACTTIPFGKGVCGVAAKTKVTQVVPDVHQYPGHIACSNKTNSEIVVPIIKDDLVVGVIDLDSENYNNYDENDRRLLESISKKIAKLF